jgi:hypothetical protein
MPVANILIRVSNIPRDTRFGERLKTSGFSRTAQLGGRDRHGSDCMTVTPWLDIQYGLCVTVLAALLAFVLHFDSGARCTDPHLMVSPLQGCLLYLRATRYRILPLTPASLLLRYYSDFTSSCSHHTRAQPPPGTTIRIPPLTPASQNSARKARLSSSRVRYVFRDPFYDAPLIGLRVAALVVKPRLRLRRRARNTWS